MNLSTARRISRTLSVAALSLIVIGFNQPRALAWGAKGHQVIARVATERLSSRARKATAELLKGASLESVAAWADQVKSTASAHFISIPLDHNDYNPKADCTGDCLITAIERNIAVLKDVNEPAAKRAEALKYVVHLIGDLHQPLHCSDNNDANGNQVRVTFFNQPTNLHSVWDTSIIEREKLPAAAYASQLVEGMNAQKSANQSGNYYLRGTTIDWALESHRLARNAYDLGDKTLGEDYYNSNKPIVDAQLFKAGIRLAKVLNDIFQSAAFAA